MMIHNTSTSQKLHERLRDIISVTQPGDRLPSEPELARQFGVSRATLREAMRTFETQGMIRRRQGSGTFVTHPPRVIESGLEVLESIERMAERIGLPVSMGEFKLEHRQAKEDEAHALGLSFEARVLHISRVIMTEGHPVAHLVDIIPDGILSPRDFGSDFRGSVLDLLIRPSMLLWQWRVPLGFNEAMSYFALSPIYTIPTGAWWTTLLVISFPVTSVSMLYAGWVSRHL
jgi:GntR family transcriptional regulator